MISPTVRTWTRPCACSSASQGMKRCSTVRRDGEVIAAIAHVVEDEDQPAAAILAHAGNITLELAEGRVAHDVRIGAQFEWIERRHELRAGADGAGAERSRSPAPFASPPGRMPRTDRRMSRHRSRAPAAPDDHRRPGAAAPRRADHPSGCGPGCVRRSRGRPLAGIATDPRSCSLVCRPDRWGCTTWHAGRTDRGPRRRPGCRHCRRRRSAKRWCRGGRAAVEVESGIPAEQAATKSTVAARIVGRLACSFMLCVTRDGQGAQRPGLSIVPAGRRRGYRRSRDWCAGA